MPSSIPSKILVLPASAPIPWQDIAGTASVVGAAVNVATVWRASFGISIGRQSATAFSAGWPNVRIEGSYGAGGNGRWFPLHTTSPAVGTTVGKTTLNGAIIAGATTLVLTSATNFLQGDILYLGHTTTPANYEIARVKTLATATVTFEEPCQYAHTTASIVSNQAVLDYVDIDLRSFTEVRAVVDNCGSGIVISVEVAMTINDRDHV